MTKTEVIRLRCTKEEKDIITKIAASEHRTVSNYLWQLIEKDVSKKLEES